MKHLIVYSIVIMTNACTHQLCSCKIENIKPSIGLTRVPGYDAYGVVSTINIEGTCK